MIAAKRSGAIEIPLKYAAARIRLPAGIGDSLAEIRLRAGRPAAAVTSTGVILRCSEPFTREDIEACFMELCRNSVHSFSKEIAEGYITLAGGCRVGFCGSAVIQNGALTALKEISSLNIRFAREVKGCGEELYRRVFSDGLRSLILGGRPLSGKTTVMRDLCRLLGERHRVALIDSRSEIAACFKGAPALDVGENTDVLTGYPRAEGITCALRSLSPEIIVCDEIGNDAEAIEQCMLCGVKLAATAHAEDMDELLRRPALQGVLRYFETAAVLGGCGRISQVRELSASVYCGGLTV